MLPYKAGNLVLSEDSLKRLDSFYQRYCEGENAGLYGVSHMIYACHAAFPLILTPTLANIIWLNFNKYYNKTGLQKMERVIVSDFLLSPLLRPVANRQFELIPEIRTYLLYLLKDGRWFKSRGIEDFGDERLRSLATFLRQYLNDKISNGEVNSTGFREINTWASLAYLEPDELAVDIAEAYQKTFSEDSKKKNDSYKQMRLNMLIDRFGQQLDEDIKKNNDTPEIFMNLRKYSNGQKAFLFNKGQANDQVSGLFNGLDSNFIGSADSSSLTLRIPASGGIAQRLERKKNSVQKIISLLISIENYNAVEYKLKSSENNIREFAELLSEQSGKRTFEIPESKILRNEQATYSAIFESIATCFREANEEDIILVYYSGLGSHVKESTIIPFSEQDPKSQESTYSISHIQMRDFLRNQKVHKNCQVVLVLDTDVNGFDSFVTDNDIQITAVRNNETQYEMQTGEAVSTFLAFSLKMILNRTFFQVTYSDLAALFRNIALQDSHTETETPVIKVPGAALNNFFLTHKQRTLAKRGHMIIYNDQADCWRVVDEDFDMVTLNTHTNIYDYHTCEMIDDVSGELYIQDNIIKFSGRVQGLDRNKIYTALPKRTELRCTVTEQASTANAAELTDLINGFKGTRYSSWDNLYLEPAPGSRVIPSKSASIGPYRIESHEQLRINISQSNTGNSYELVFDEDPSADSPVSKQVTAVVPDANSCITFIYKLSRYWYLLNISPGNEFNSVYDPIMAEMNIWTIMAGDTAGPTTMHQDLEIGKNSYYIMDGNVIMNEFMIEVRSREKFPLFYDIYLLSSDLRIKRLTTGKTNIIEPGGNISLPVSEDELIQQLLNNNITAAVRIIMSRDPITIDFSQDGSN